MTFRTILSAHNFSKSFYGREVLKAVDLDVMAGEVHALLGQNGSGKSTLIKCLSGYHAPEPGAELRINGQEVALPLDPARPRGLGLAFVHQQLGLAATLTVLENLQVGRFRTGWGWRIRWGENRREVRRALAKVGLKTLSPQRLVGSLTEVERAMVAMARAFHELDETESGVLVLDEPTASLPRDGVERLFEAIRSVTAHGAGVLFVTHRLEEVIELADRVTVLRDGARVATAEVAAITERDLIEMIVGRSLQDFYPSAGEVRDDVLLSVRDACGANIEDFSLRLHRGETVGLTGLEGMGQETIPYLLFGADPEASGEIAVEGRRAKLDGFKPGRAIKLGMALVPADRLRNGGVGVASVGENITITTLPEYVRSLGEHMQPLGRISRRRERRAVESQIEALQVMPPDPRHKFAELSGGNQQKVVLAKWFGTKPQILLMHEPTQGVDVGARQEVFRLIRRFTDAGGGALIASTEYEDLANICDRVIVFRDGRNVAELQGDSLTPEALVEQAFLSSSANGHSPNGRSPQEERSS